MFFRRAEGRQNIPERRRAGLHGLCFYFTRRRGDSASHADGTKSFFSFTLLDHFWSREGARAGVGEKVSRAPDAGSGKRSSRRAGRWAFPLVILTSLFPSGKMMDKSLHGPLPAGAGAYLSREPVCVAAGTRHICRS